MNTLQLVEKFLPQLKDIFSEISVVTEQDQREWLMDLIENKIDINNNFENKIQWHINRLKGIGGSDIAALVHTEMGVYDIFSNANKIISEKLLKSKVKLATATMEKGTMLEPLAREKFYNFLAKKNFVFSRDKEAFKTIENYNKLEKKDNEWLIGNPDDIILIENKDGSCSRFIVDYKVPADKNYEDNIQILDNYKYQLNHYCLILEKCCNLPVDGLLLAYLVQDYNNIYKIKTLKVEKDVILQKNILQVGDKYWQMRNRGEIPEISNIALIENKKLSLELKNKYIQMVNLYAYADVHKKYYEKLMQEKKQEIKENIFTAEQSSLLSGEVGGQYSFNLGDALTVSTKKQLNIEAIVQDKGEEFLQDCKKEIISKIDTNVLVENFKVLCKKYKIKEEEFEQACNEGQFSETVYDVDLISQKLGEQVKNYEIFDDFRFIVNKDKAKFLRDNIVEPINTNIINRELLPRLGIDFSIEEDLSKKNKITSPK